MPIFRSWRLSGIFSRVVQCRGCVGSQITQAANRIWLPTQPRHCTTREKISLSRQLLKMGTRWSETCWATYKEQLIRRNKYNTKWHLVGFLFNIELRCTINHTSNFAKFPNSSNVESSVPNVAFNFQAHNILIITIHGTNFGPVIGDHYYYFYYYYLLIIIIIIIIIS